MNEERGTKAKAKNKGKREKETTQHGIKKGNGANLYNNEGIEERERKMRKNRKKEQIKLNNIKKGNEGENRT